MRRAFIETLCRVAETDHRIWLLSGDLGYSILDQFEKEFPSRFVNVGVAEQNMAGVAAGLALEGKIVFIYSIANFSTIRCLEQIRNDICYHNLSVKVVAVGAGLSYGSQGYTHHAVEDIAVMKVLPNMTVVVPCDDVETRLAVRAIVNRSGPCYLRLGKGNEPIIHDAIPSFEIGKAIELRQGSDVTIVCVGGMVSTGLYAADRLKLSGVSARVLSMHTVYPLDEFALVEAAEQSKAIVTLEEHGFGGLCSSVSEVIAQRRLDVGFLPLRLQREPRKYSGNQEFLKDDSGLSPEKITAAIIRLLS